MVEVLYTKDHEYIKINGDIGIVGISDHAQDALGDIVFVELPEIGAEAIKGEQIGVIESVKSASELYSPVSGEVLEVNTDLESDPALVNSDPEGKGWIYKIKITNTAELEGLKSEEEYKAEIEG